MSDPEVSKISGAMGDPEFGFNMNPASRPNRDCDAHSPSEYMYTQSNSPTTHPDTDADD